MRRVQTNLVRDASFDAPHRPLNWGGVMPTWQSNGGGYRGHPARTLPHSIRIALPTDPGRLLRISLVGVFARYCTKAEEAPGTPGAVLQIGDDDAPMVRYELVNGRHYTDGAQLDPVERALGDGTFVKTVGNALLDGDPVRVDKLTFEVPDGSRPLVAVLRDLGSPASFVLAGVTAEIEPVEACPFKSTSGGVPLSELPSIMRMGERSRFDQALRQMAEGVAATQDLDEARGEALTFLAVVTAATLELGATREMHRALLNAARKMDDLESPTELAREAKIMANGIAARLFEERGGPSTDAIHQALAHVMRNYAKPLNDSDVATAVGLSTSHFRHLFREATGHPFHRYLTNLRLERARRLLLETDLPVAEVATAVGFTGLPHFSRAFSQRFSVAPSRLRRAAG